MWNIFINRKKNILFSILGNWRKILYIFVIDEKYCFFLKKFMVLSYLNEFIYKEWIYGYNFLLDNLG